MGGAGALLPPLPEGSTPSTHAGRPPGPLPDVDRRRAALAALALVAVVLLAIVVVPGPQNLTYRAAGAAGTTTFSHAFAESNNAVAGLPGGPWSFVAANAWMDSQGYVWTENSSYDCQLNFADTALPPVSASDIEQGSMPWWGFSYAGAAGTVAFVEVILGAPAVTATVPIGSPCLDGIVPAGHAVASLVDSSLITAALEPGLSEFLRNASVFNGDFFLEWGGLPVPRAPPTADVGWHWVMSLYGCSNVIQSAFPTGPVYVAATNATAADVLFGGTSGPATCSG